MGDISRTMVLPALEPEDIEVMKAAFKKADKEGKGKLSANEVKDVLAVVLKAKFDLSAVNDIMTLVDDDGDRMLNYEELAKLFTNGPSSGDEQKRLKEWKTLFKMADVDDPTEAEIVEDFIRKFDEDGDERIDYFEFMK